MYTTTRKSWPNFVVNAINFSDLDLGSAIFAFVFMLFLAVSVYGHGLYTRTCKTGSPEYRKSGRSN